MVRIDPDERYVEPPLPRAGLVGIDLGITRFATLSDGTFYAPLNSFKRHETALRKAQQAMSRKTTSSNNWKKAKGLFSVSMPGSAMADETSYTRPRPRSAKTTR